MDATLRILTVDEAEALATDLLAKARGQPPDSNINMAAACLTPDGKVLIDLFGVMERHDSFALFLQAYGIEL